MRRIVFCLAAAGALALPAIAGTPENGGPYNASFVVGGAGIERELKGADALVGEGAPYAITAWVRPDARQAGVVVLIALGEAEGKCRCVTLNHGHPMLLDGPTTVTSRRPAPPGKWTHLAAVSDGTVLRLYVDGKEAGRTAIASRAVPAKIALAPVMRNFAHFGGSLVEAKVDDTAPSAAEVLAMAKNPPGFDSIEMWKVGGDAIR